MQAVYDYFSLALPSIIIYLSYFFSLVLWMSKEQENHKTVLSLLTAVIGTNFLNVLLLNQELLGHEWNLGVFLGLLYGPLTYLFVQSMMYQQELTIGNVKMHFIPALLGLIITIPFNAIDYYTYSKIMAFPVIIHMGAYLYVSLRAIRGYKEELRNNVSDLSDYNLKWIRNLIIIFVAVIAALLVQTIFQELNEKLVSTIVFAFTLFLVSYLYYKSINQSLLLILKKEKYEKNTLTDEEVETIYQKLEWIMKSEQIYLNADLTISDLADKIEEKSHNISRVINERTGQNFYEYVNSFRVAEAKKLLTNPASERDRIGEIMYDSGFNSKSTFNLVFKKETGLTPSQFRKKNSPSS